MASISVNGASLRETGSEQDSICQQETNVKGNGKGKGKGKGKGAPPPPPTREAAAKAKQDVEERRRLYEQEKKREAEERIRQAKEMEAAKAEFGSRLASSQPNDINSVRWETTSVKLHLTGGKGGELSGGVDALELAGGTVICLRRQVDLFATELIADRLATALDVRVAGLRLVHPSEAEHEEIGAVLKRTDPFRDAETQKMIDKMLETQKKDDPAAYARLSKYFTAKSTYGVLEFLPGCGLDRAYDALASPSDAMLAGMGRLCTLDILLNNMDRIPLPLWNNDGNLTNAIVLNDGSIAGIDQQVNVIQPGPGLDHYLGRVNALVSELLSAADASSVVEKVRGALCNVGGAELSHESMSLFIQSFQQALRDVADRWDSGELEAALDEAGQVVRQIVKCDSEGDFVEPAIRDAGFVRLVAAEVAAAVRSAAAAVAEA